VLLVPVQLVQLVPVQLVQLVLQVVQAQLVLQAQPVLQEKKVQLV
jgi:hypothetical protein